MAMMPATPPTLSAAATSVALDQTPSVSSDKNACCAPEPSVNAPPLTQSSEDVQTIGPDAAAVWFNVDSPGISIALVQ